MAGTPATGAGASGTATGRSETPAGAGKFSAVSGTTTTGDSLETATVLMLRPSAAGAETAIPAPSNATAGTAANTLRHGTVVVSSRVRFDMSLPGTDSRVRPPPAADLHRSCLLYTSPSPRDGLLSRMP